MAKISKNGDSRSTSTIDLGERRKKRIRAYAAQKSLEGTRISNIDDAVNALVDESLDRHKIPA